METLHPNVRFVWVGGAVAFAAVIAGVGLLAGQVLSLLPVGLEVVGGVAGAVAVLLGVHALLRYRVWGFDVEEDALFLRRGVLTSVETAVPYVRVQHVDTRRSPLERLAGLSSVVVYTAGSRGADVTIPGLRPERARELREQLRALAIESEPGDAV